ncbi:hypothetical protein GCM10017608_15690 [Agromyces luteolus]|nr:hypothetical protein GCM10017608_15690 [Agromyces luteolus]
MLAGYRILRRLASGERADVHLAVVGRPPIASPDEPEPEPVLVVVRVYDRSADDEAIAREIDAMEHDPTCTVPRLLDVATLPDGRACLVVERIGGRTLASMLDGAHLSPGQVVTALAPLLVAVRELGRRGLVHSRLAPSDVLVDEAGRPRLIGLGALARTDARVPASERTEHARRAHAALVDLMEAVVAGSIAPARFGPPIELARGMLHGRPFAPDHETIERALFAIAEPVPLIVPQRSAPGGSLPSRVPPAVAGTDRVESDGGALHAFPSTTEPPRLALPEPVVPPVLPSRRSTARRLAELAQLPGIADGLEGTLDEGAAAALRRRLRGWIRRRPAVLATGGFVGAGALVLLLTAVPPAAAGDAAPTVADSAADTHANASTDPTSDPTAEAASEAVGDGTDVVARDASGEIEAEGMDPAAVAAALLEIRQGCLAGRDLACVAAYAQPGAPIEARDVAAIAGGESIGPGPADLSAISVTADLGDAVVVSVPGADGREPASLLMMRSEAGWRLREWFD